MLCEVLFVLDRGTQVERAVKPGGVVPVEPSEEFNSRFGSSCKVFAVNDLAFEAGEGRLGHRVVVTVTDGSP